MSLQTPLLRQVVQELLEVEAKLTPLEARKEELKEALRTFGPNVYPITGMGTVQVSKPSIAQKTGTKLVVKEDRLDLLSTSARKEVFDTGFVAEEDVFSRASKSRVEITLVA